jgi:AcrR family transcriptional regulator
MSAPRIRKSAEDRKAEIVAAAIRIAAETGPDRVTTERLAQAIGLSQPAIFRHFPDKDAIWQAVAGRIAVALDVEAERALPAGDAVDRLRALVARHHAHLAANPAIPAILFSSELHAGSPALRRAFAAIMANRQAVFAAVLSDGVATGVFRADLDPDQGGALIVTLIQGTALRWSLNGRVGDLVAEGQAMLALALDGFRAGG